MSDLDTMKAVAFLAPLDDAALERLAQKSRRATFPPGACLMAELEAGSDLFVLMSGDAEVSVDARGGTRKVVRKLGAGCAFGEMSSLTGELRSATVTAITEVDAMVISDADFDQLREERPEVAVVLVRELAQRLLLVEESLEALLSSTDPEVVHAERGPRATRKGSIRRAWRELVVGRKRDLAFLTLSAFVLTLIFVRATVYSAFRLDLDPQGVLRTFYMTGFALLGLSAGVSLLTFRPSFRRLIAIAYGVGIALILNELGVTLAFDIFYKDIHTADPNVPFDVERLYRRAEPLRAIALGLVVLVQAAYLRKFYRRAAFVVMTRLRRFRK